MAATVGLLTDTDGSETTDFNITLTAKQVIILSFAFGLLVGGFGMGMLNGFAVGTPTGAAFADTNDDSQPTQGNDQPSRVQVSTDDDPVKGDADAPVTIIEFSDFECPFCSRFYTDTLPQLESNYVDTGKVKIVYRDFPLGFHPNAHLAAEAAECAQEQGMFWEYHDTVFENQDQLGKASLKQWAADLGLDTQQFNSCLDNGDMTSEVDSDMSDGQSAGVSGTPTFFIGNPDDGYVKLVGAQPYQAFEQAIEAELNN